MPFNDSNFLEVKDCIFIKGLPTSAHVKISDVSEYFEERVGECRVQMTALSKDKRWFFVAVKFKSSLVAESVMERYNGKNICGHRVTLSYWRVPRNMAHSGRLRQNSYMTRRWEKRVNSDDKAEVHGRRKEEYSRERHSWDTKHAPSDTVCHDNKEDFSEDSDNFRDYDDDNCSGHYRYKTSGNYDYEEQSEEYLPQHWDSDGVEGSYYDDSRNGWESDYNDSSENLSERELYDREELSYHHEENIWQESEVNQDRDPVFNDQTGTWDYESSNYPEVDRNRELNFEPLEGSLRDDCVDSQYNGYHERHSEETSFSTENHCARKIDWLDERESCRTQDLQTRRQEDIQNSFSFDQTNHWRRWEVAAPSNPMKRRLSDPDIPQKTCTFTAGDQDIADQKSCNVFRDLTGRKPQPSSEENPRSDEWLNRGRRHFQNRSRHSVSPVNLWSEDCSREGLPVSEEIRKCSSETFDNKTSLDRTHGGDFVRSIGSRRSNSPLRDTSLLTNRYKRSLSSERSSDFKLYKTSPRNERSTRSCNEEKAKAAIRQIDSHSCSPRGRYRNNRVQKESGNPKRTSGRKGCDLRRSLMLHQQRKQFPRDRSIREVVTKHSSLEKGRKASPDEHNTASSSAESTSPLKGGNRKRRQCENEKTRQDIGKPKKRKQTSHSTVTHSDTASGDSESPGKKTAKAKSEIRKQSPRDQKKSREEPRDQVSEKSDTKRADRLLSYLAATLAEDNISLRRPSPGTDVSQGRAFNSISSAAHRKLESARGPTVKAHGYMTRSKGSHNNRCRPEQDEAIKQAAKDDNFQLMDSNGGVSCTKETAVGWYPAETPSEGGVNTTESVATKLAVLCLGGNSDQDVDEAAGFCGSTKQLGENSYNAGKSASPKVKFQQLKPSLENPVLWGTSDLDEKGVMELFGEGSTELLGENSCNAEESASSPKVTFQALEHSQEDSHITDDFEKMHKRLIDETVVSKKTNKKEFESLNHSSEHPDYAEIKTNSTYITDDFEKTRKLLVDETVVSKKTNKKEFESLNLDFTEIETNCSFIIDDFENAHKLVADEIVVSSKKTNVMELLGQGEEGISQKENCHVVDMEFSSDDEISPDFPGSSNTNKEIVINAETEKCITNKANSDLTNTEQKASDVGDISFTDTISVLHHTKPSICSIDFSQVGRDTLKQGAYNMEPESSEVENTGPNHTGSCLLYTEPSLCSVKMDSEDALTQGSYNIKDRNCANSTKRTTCTKKEDKVDAIYTEQELSYCNSANAGDQDREMNLVKETRDVERFDSNPQGKEHATVHVNNSRQLVELANGQEKTDKGGHANVTQGEICHDCEDGHVYNTVSEEGNVKDSKLYTNSKGQDKGIDNVQREFCNEKLSFRRREKTHDTGQGISGISVVSDTHQEIFNNKEEGKNETCSDIEWCSGKRTEAVAVYRDQETHEEKSINAMHNEKGVSEAYNIETNAENARIDALNTQREVCEKESNDATSCVSNVIQEGRNAKNIDFDITMEDEERKCDDGALKIYSMDDVCVTQQKMHSFDRGNPSNNSSKESHGYVTQQEGRVMQDLSKSNLVSNVSIKAQQVLDTDSPSVSVSILEQGDCSKTTKVDPGVLGRRYSSCPNLETYQSHEVLSRSTQESCADTDKPATSSPNTCSTDQDRRESEDLVPKNLQHVDERQTRLIDSADRVVNDASKRYSPSSPTKKSDEHCSPRSKELSPYSPSHPTNVSEGDMEQNDAVKELCYDDEDDKLGSSTYEVREEINSGALKNSLKSDEVNNNESITNATALKQMINNDSISVTSENSFRVSSSPKSKSGYSHCAPILDDIIDVNLPEDDVGQCGGENTSNKRDGDGNDGAARFRDSAADDSGKNSQKHLIKCPKRTQSLPNVSSVVPRPQVVYLTATKTKHVYTDSGSQNKPRIFYATSDMTTKPARSLSLDDVPGRDWPFGKSSCYDSKNSERPTVFETEKRNEGIAGRDVKLLPTKQSGDSGSPLKLGNGGIQDSGLDVGKVSTVSKSESADNMAVVVKEESGKCMGSIPSIDKENPVLSNTCIAQQGSVDKRSGSILKDKDIASACTTPLVQDTLCQDGGAGNEAITVQSDKQGTEGENVRVRLTSHTSGKDEQEASPTDVNDIADKAVNKSKSDKKYNGEPCTSIDTNTDEDIFAPKSVPGNERLVSTAPFGLRQKESSRSYSATTFQAKSQNAEVSTCCNLSMDKVVEDIKLDTYCGTVDTPVTFQVIDKRPSTSTRQIATYRHGNFQPRLLASYDPSGSTVSENKVGNRKEELNKESLFRAPEERDVLLQKVQVMPTCSSPSAGKRRHQDSSSKPTHRCKVPRKRLKLIIPTITNQASQPGAQRTAKPSGKNLKKISSCTMTCADLDFVQDSSNLPISEVDTDANKGLFRENKSVDMNYDVMTTSVPHTTTTNPSGTAKPGVNLSRKTSSCTVTRADLDFVPGSNGVPINEMYTGTKEDMSHVHVNGNVMTTSAHPSITTNQVTSLEPRGIAKHRAKYLKKTSSCTTTRTDLDFVPGSNSIPINEGNTGNNENMFIADKRSGTVNSELVSTLSPPSSKTTERENNPLSQGSGCCSSTGNTSLLPEHLSANSQHNKPSLTSVEDINIEENRAKGVLTEGQASFMGQESDWIAFKMAQLRKKKEEIEQVYKRECQTVVNVVKLLVSNDPRLEGVLQNAVRRSLQDMGQRCVQELEKETRPAT